MLLQKHPTPPAYRERRWPGAMAVVAVAALHTALPDVVQIRYLPWWLLGAVVIILEIPALLAHSRGLTNLPAGLGMAASGVVTLFLMASVSLLVYRAIFHQREALSLLESSGILWLANIIVFATWYWRLDAGGPHQREREAGHRCGAFLFPQMAIDPKQLQPGMRNWNPMFIDYLFIAFNTSTAFSPTDCPILSRWAKALVMLQSLISLMLIAIIVGRAVNAL